TPQPFPLIAFPRAWTPGTNGAVTANAVLAVIDRQEDFAKWQGKLHGKNRLAARAVTINPATAPVARRVSRPDLADMQAQQVTAGRGRGAAPANPPPNPNFGRERMQFFVREGAVAVLEPSSDHGAIVVTGVNASRDAKEPPTAAQIVVASEHYNQVVR